VRWPPSSLLEATRRPIFFLTVPLSLLGSPAMMKAYKSGIPGNGKPFPDGDKIAKIMWGGDRPSLSGRVCRENVVCCLHLRMHWDPYHGDSRYRGPRLKANALPVLYSNLSDDLPSVEFEGTNVTTEENLLATWQPRPIQGNSPSK
jgi:hypothetical protein